MVRSRVVVVGVVVWLWVAAAAAQTVPASGFLTGHAGVASGGDVQGRRSTLGASLAVVETNGVGAELDIAHVRTFDADRFAESGLTTLTIGPTWVRPHPVIRPYVSLGVGLLRVRAADAGGSEIASRTDWGLSAGGGLFYLLSDAIALRGDVRYQRLLQRHDDVPLRDGGFFDFWRTSVGVSFAWPLR